MMNTAQGSQSTNSELGSLQANGIAIGMHGKACWLDGVFVERLWKSIKYEEVFQQAYDIFITTKAGLGRHLTFYDERRTHNSLDGRTPDTVYFNSLPLAAA